MIPHFLGNSLPILKFVTILYWNKSSRLLSFGPCSNAPKPIVLFLLDAEIVAKSAKLVSKLTTAAIPPLLSISANLSSLNQTSPRMLLALVALFFTPTIKVLTNPKLGFPRIPSLNLPLLVFEANEGSKTSSSINRIPLISSAGAFPPNANTFSWVSKSNDKLISFNSGQTSDGEEAPSGVTFNGIST